MNNTTGKLLGGILAVQTLFLAITIIGVIATALISPSMSASSVITGVDFDGDGLTDPAIYHSADGGLWWRQSGDGEWGNIQFSTPQGAQLVLDSDYDGDGIVDPAIYYPDHGGLWWKRSRDNAWDHVDFVLLGE